MSATIAVDARTLFQNRRRGTGKNLLDLYRAVAALRPEWRFLLYHRTRNPEALFDGFANVQPRRIDIRGDRWALWQHVRLPLASRTDGADLLHCPANSCPRRSSVPLVSTIHDLIPLKVPDPVSNGYAVEFAHAVSRCLEKSKRIITVSRSTRRDLISDFGADPQKIRVIAWAPDSSCRAPLREAELKLQRSRYHITDRYILAFSGRSRRKNAEGMIQGYARLDDGLRRRFQFLIVGVEPAPRRRRLQELIVSLGMEDRCLVRGFVPEDDVAPLLQGAEALIFCSLYEGFGLPILDAFACGTAVLTSHVSSMPEVAGDAAIYCEPSDAESIAAGMDRILRAEELRRTLVHRGTQRLQMFSWERAANSLCGVFEECLS